MQQVFLSNIELYFSKNINIGSSENLLDGEEFDHAFKVMRNNLNSNIFITDGKGTILKTVVIDITKKYAKLKTLEIFNYTNNLANIEFFIPNLRNSDRMEFALEKCIELGITNFTLYNSDRTIHKGIKIERLNKIAISSIKQSLRAFLPTINFSNNLINSQFNGELIILEQTSDLTIQDFLLNKLDIAKGYSFIIGPEGGFSDKELEYLKAKSIKLKLSQNRLRSETACIVCASLLNNFIINQ